MRIDKFLWAVRVFKTRSSATDRIREGKVEVEGGVAKPSREVKEGEEVVVRKGAIRHSYRVKGIPKGRVGPKLVDDYIENRTPLEELERERVLRDSQRNTQFLVGRPTKKDRRDWRKFMG